MGLVGLETYDVQTCADYCTTRAPDEIGGPCVYINIWRALINGEPGATTCSLVRTSSSFCMNVSTTHTATGSTILLLMRQRRPIPGKANLQSPIRVDIN